MLHYDDPEMPIPGLIRRVNEIMIKIPKKGRSKEGSAQKELGGVRSLGMIHRGSRGRRPASQIAVRNWRANAKN
jgi:hypothetical protein